MAGLSVREAADRIEAVLEPDMEQVTLLGERVKAFLADRGLARLVFDVGLLYREAAINAVVHGCREGGGRRVEVALRLEPSAVVLEVGDDGPGFDWRSASFDLPGEDRVSGRGLFILRRYADRLDFQGAGNRIVAVKHVAKGGSVMDNVRREGGKAVITPKAGVFSMEAESIKDLLADLVADGVRSLVLDFSEVEIIDSIGVGLLVATHNSLKQVGGELIVEKASQDIYNLLATMRLNTHFAIRKAA